MSGLILSGMHHSGTSVIARLLADAGWDPGLKLLPNDPVNGKSFGEDSEFVALNRSWLACPDGERDVPSDWGVNQGDAVPVSVRHDWVGSAHDYSRQRDQSSPHWLAKDPRSSLTLGIWSQVPSLRFLIIYRNPWDVVESLMRYGAPFTGRPDWAFAVWKAYNQNLLESIENLGSRAMVVSSSAVLAQPREFLERVSNWAGVELAESQPEKAIDPLLYRNRPEGSHISRIFQILHPETSVVLNRLDELAEFPREKIHHCSSAIVPGGGSKTRKAIHVILPCRNDGQFLTESITSVEETAGSVNVPVELTVVDGASDDAATLEYFRRLSDAGYQTIRVEKRGPSAARNAGLKKSKSKVVIPLDADNQLLPPIMIGALKVLDGEADVVYGPWRRFGLDNRVVNPPHTVDWSSFIPHNTIDVCAPVSRRLLKRLRGWDDNVIGLEDWDLWIRALQKNARFHRIDDVMFEYVVRPGSMLWELAESSDQGASAVAQVVERHMRKMEKRGIDVSGWQQEPSGNEI
jgi:hypothetical protein